MRHWSMVGTGVGLAALLAGCMASPGGTAMQPRAQVGTADPADPCGPQVVVFVSAGDLFGEAPRPQGPASPEDLARDLARENAALDRLQIAFDALLYCRWTEVRVIRADAASGSIPAPLARARLEGATGRLRSDLGHARQVRARVADRAARIEAAVERAAPGTAAALLADRAAREAPSRALASAPVVLRLRPDAVAPEVGRVAAGTEVALRPAAGGFGFIDAGPRRQGYAQLGAFTVLQQRRVGAAEADAGPAAALRRLAASNLAKRDNFTESLDVAEGSAAPGFEEAL